MRQRRIQFVIGDETALFAARALGLRLGTDRLDLLGFADNLWSLSEGLEGAVFMLCALTDSIARFSLKWKASSLKILLGRHVPRDALESFAGGTDGHQWRAPKLAQEEVGWVVVCTTAAGLAVRVRLVDATVALGVRLDDVGSSEGSVMHAVAACQSAPAYSSVSSATTGFVRHALPHDKCEPN